MNCEQQSYGSIVWAVVGIVVLVLIFHAIISSKIAEAKRKKIHDAKRAEIKREYLSGQIFDVWTKHGVKFERIKLLREYREAERETNLIVGDTLVFEKEDGMRLTIRKNAVRMMKCVAVSK